jgi:hypothetical protein
LKQSIPKEQPEESEIVFMVLQPFLDPYTGATYQEWQHVKESDLKHAGWKAADFKAATTTYLLKQES